MKKTMLITGASKGLGKVCTNHFRKKGYNVIDIKGRNDCDFADKDAVEQLAFSLAEKHESIDIIIHCAGGGFGYSDDFPTWEQLETLYRVNVVAPAIINKALVPHMIERKNGNIIHISSITARYVIGSVGYSMAKSCVLSYVRILGKKLAGSGVIVTGLIPGTFISPGNNWDRYIKEGADFLPQFIKDNCPKGRLGTVEEVIPLIEFLISDKATMMCGCCVPIDGGEGVTYP